MPELNNKKHRKNEILSVFLIAAAILLGLFLWLPAVKSGVLGLFIRKCLFGLFGTLTIILPAVILVIAIDRLLTKKQAISKTRKNCTMLLFVAASILISVITLNSDKVYQAARVAGNSSVFKAIAAFWKSGMEPALISNSTTWSGGLLGGLFGFSLSVLTGRVGSMIIMIAMILALLVVSFNISYTYYLKKSAQAFKDTRAKLEENRRIRREEKQAKLEEQASLQEQEALQDEQKPDAEADSDAAQTDDAEEEFGFDLSKRLDDHDPRDVSTEWLKKELAKEQDIPYETPFQINYDLPEGSWKAENPSDLYGASDGEISFPQYPGFSDLSVETPTDQSDADDSAYSPEEQGLAAQDTPAAPDPEQRAEQDEIRRDDLSREAEVPQTEDAELEKISAGISEADFEMIEDHGRAHWDNRSDDSGGVEFASQKKKKQISFTDRYVPPDFDLLNQEPQLKQDEETIAEIKRLGARLEQTLNSFGVDAKVVNYTTGPTITRFELSPGPGVKVSRITNLSDDIALALAAMGVRIEAPIPGKSAIGIEIPNQETHPVYLGGIIRSKAFRENHSILTAGIGRDIQGNEILCDLAKMPHLLIAGATGSGKSVCINAIIISLLYRSGPSDLRMIMIDPKVVELNVYNGIPHLMQPVVTNPKKAYGALNWAIGEMESRYEKFADNSVRDFTAYNQLIKSGQIDGEKLPAIVIIIDELSDLMATTPTEVEDAIARLTAMARAAGIHLIIATQRPSVDVITGVIKANIPSRIAFTVASQVDSRTILDMGGAEKLLGKGDMLYYPQSASKPIRGQGSFVTDGEVERVVRYLKDFYETDYVDAVAKAIENAAGKGSVSGNGSAKQGEEEDELLEDALRLVVESDYASISLLQRRLSVGYPRAARIIDRLHELGYVGPPEGSKQRKVLITMEEYMKRMEDAE